MHLQHVVSNGNKSVVDSKTACNFVREIIKLISLLVQCSATHFSKGVECLNKQMHFTGPYYIMEHIQHLLLWHNQSTTSDILV